jgi:hypothetical protein
MQLYGEQIRRGYQTGNVRCVATDCLVRFLNEYIPRGWNTGRHFQHRSASAFASWSTSITAIANSDTSIERRLKLVYDKLEAMPLPIGWLPKDNSDAWITEAFEKGWPIAEEVFVTPPKEPVTSGGAVWLRSRGETRKIAVWRYRATRIQRNPQVV